MINPWTNDGPVQILFLIIGLASLSALSYAGLHFGRKRPTLAKLGWAVQGLLGFGMLGGWARRFVDVDLIPITVGLRQRGNDLLADRVDQIQWLAPTLFMVAFGLGLLIAVGVAAPERVPRNPALRIFGSFVLTATLALVFWLQGETELLPHLCGSTTRAPLELCDKIASEALRTLRIAIWLAWLLLGGLIWAQVRAMQPAAKETPSPL